MAAVVLGVATHSGSGGTSYVTGSFTPAADDLLLVYVTGLGTRAAGTVTSSVGGATFTRVTSRDVGATSRIYLFVADQLATNVSQTVTFDCTGDAATSCAIGVFRVSGMTRVGLDAVLQSATANAASGTPSITFASSVLTDNPTILGTGSGTAGSITEPTGWTELSEITNSEICSRDSGFTGTTVTYGSASPGAFGVVGAELDTSAAPGGGDSVGIGLSNSILLSKRRLAA